MKKIKTLVILISIITIFVGCDPGTKNGANIKTTDEGKEIIQLPAPPNGYIIHLIECGDHKVCVSYKSTTNPNASIIKVEYFNSIVSNTYIYRVELN